MRKGWNKIEMQVYVKGSQQAVEMYQSAFGAEMGYNVRNPDGTFMHAELMRNGQFFLAVSEAGDDFNTAVIPKYPVMNFSVEFENEAAVRKAYQVLSENSPICTSIRVLPWSDCCADIVDRFGVYWYITVPGHRPASVLRADFDNPVD
jgi:PhnB protein